MGVYDQFSSFRLAFSFQLWRLVRDGDIEAVDVDLDISIVRYQGLGGVPLEPAFRPTDGTESVCSLLEWLSYFWPGDIKLGHGQGRSGFR